MVYGLRFTEASEGRIREEMGVRSYVRCGISSAFLPSCKLAIKEQMRTDHVKRKSKDGGREDTNVMW